MALFIFTLVLSKLVRNDTCFVFWPYVKWISFLTNSLGINVNYPLRVGAKPLFRFTEWVWNALCSGWWKMLLFSIWCFVIYTQYNGNVVTVWQTKNKQKIIMREIKTQRSGCKKMTTTDGERRNILKSK